MTRVTQKIQLTREQHWQQQTAFPELEHENCCMFTHIKVDGWHKNLENLEDLSPFFRCRWWSVALAVHFACSIYSDTWCSIHRKVRNYISKRILVLKLCDVVASCSPWKLIWARNNKKIKCCTLSIEKWIGMLIEVDFVYPKTLKKNQRGLIYEKMRSVIMHATFDQLRVA